MSGCKPMATPLVCNEKLRKDDGEKKVDKILRRSLVGNLLYLTTTRPDIMFAANLLSRIMNNPTQKHFGCANDMKRTYGYVFSLGSGVFSWLSNKQQSVAQSSTEADYKARYHVYCKLAVKIMNNPTQKHFGVGKRVLRYIQGTMNYGIKYGRNFEVILIGFCDRDWAGCADDMKRTYGYVFSLDSCVFSWLSKKQQSIAQSSAEVEYVSASNVASQAIWLRRILEDIGEKQEEATEIFCDNKSTIAMAKNPCFHSKTRHINIKHHFVREAIEEEEINLSYVRSKEQLAPHKGTSNNKL
ncbi:hypothetical protein EZV62_005489 [Acer yangbiense]|uniref:Reverse transcriptase Ty1/copia-type domain-containing protein n=1 Tax=Acer yangbiense TaxID=1000413 RepID=A0A5C7INV6_9ROSI|nr:hypothetical protein EZV62_005489 [Acer yangbiense]